MNTIQIRTNEQGNKVVILPVYDNNKKTDIYNVYSACVVINKAANGKLYLYDIVDIKKEASNPFKTNE